MYRTCATFWSIYQVEIFGLPEATHIARTTGNNGARNVQSISDVHKQTFWTYEVIGFERIAEDSRIDSLPAYRWTLSEVERPLTQVGTNYEDHQYLFDSNSSQVLLQEDERGLGKDSCTLWKRLRIFSFCEL